MQNADEEAGTTPSAGPQNQAAPDATDWWSELQVKMAPTQRSEALKVVRDVEGVAEVVSVDQA